MTLTPFTFISGEDAAGSHGGCRLDPKELQAPDVLTTVANTIVDPLSCVAPSHLCFFRFQTSAELVKSHCPVAATPSTTWGPGSKAFN